MLIDTDTPISSYTTPDNAQFVAHLAFSGILAAASVKVLAQGGLTPLEMDRLLALGDAVQQSLEKALNG